MPTEYYIGIAIALILICLLALLIKPTRSARVVIQQKRIDSDQLASQLSRIADSLEILVAHLGASSTSGKLPIEKQSIKEPLPVELPVEKSPTVEPPVLVDSAVEPSNPEQEKVEQPVERHVRLSMFGR